MLYNGLVQKDRERNEEKKDVRSKGSKKEKMEEEKEREKKRKKERRTGRSSVTRSRYYMTSINWTTKMEDDVKRKP